MDDNSPPLSDEDRTRRTVNMAILGIAVAGFCSLFLAAFFYFRPDELSMVAKYFPSATVTPTSIPTRTPTVPPTPNLTATQNAWVRPAESPSLGGREAASTAVEQGTAYLDNYLIHTPPVPDVNQPGDRYVFEVLLNQSEPLIWSYGWCTTNQKILDENFAHMKLVFRVNERSIPLEEFAIVDAPGDNGSTCREYASLITQWPEGQHQLETHVTFTQSTNDGWNAYPAGTHVFEYIVTVKH